MHPSRRSGDHSRNRFSLFSGARTTLSCLSTFLIFGFFLVTFLCSCQSSCVVFFLLYFLIIFPLCFRIRLFSFFREEQQSFFQIKFNDVTPSTNFLVCSKCVIGDSQQDRNARAYFLVKQRQSIKLNNTYNQTEKKNKQTIVVYTRNKRSVQIETAHKWRYVFKLFSCLTVSRSR